MFLIRSVESVFTATTFEKSVTVPTTPDVVMIDNVVEIPVDGAVRAKETLLEICPLKLVYLTKSPSL